MSDYFYLALSYWPYLITGRSEVLTQHTGNETKEADLLRERTYPTSVTNRLP